jgi:hypothetical protein
MKKQNTRQSFGHGNDKGHVAMVAALSGVITTAVLCRVLPNGASAKNRATSMALLPALIGASRHFFHACEVSRKNVFAVCMVEKTRQRLYLLCVYLRYTANGLSRIFPFFTFMYFFIKACII